MELVKSSMCTSIALDEKLLECRDLLKGVHIPNLATGKDVRR